MENLIDVLNSHHYSLNKSKKESSIAVEPSRSPKITESYKIRKRFDEEILIDALNENLESNEYPTMKNFFPSKTAADRLKLSSKYNNGRSKSPGNQKYQTVTILPHLTNNIDDNMHTNEEGRKGPKNFNIRKLKPKRDPPKGQIRTLNLVPVITPDINQPTDFKPKLKDNRLANSKHILIKTFNRYLANPSGFQKNAGIHELADLNTNFTNADITVQLFKTGLANVSTDQYSKF